MIVLNFSKCFCKFEFNFNPSCQRNKYLKWFYLLLAIQKWQFWIFSRCFFKFIFNFNLNWQTSNQNILRKFSHLIPFNMQKHSPFFNTEKMKLQVHLRISCLSVDEGREEQWIPKEEDGRIVAYDWHEVPGSLFASSVYKLTAIPLGSLGQQEEICGKKKEIRTIQKYHMYASIN